MLARNFITSHSDFQPVPNQFEESAISVHISNTSGFLHSDNLTKDISLYFQAYLTCLASLGREWPRELGKGTHSHKILNTRTYISPERRAADFHTLVAYVAKNDPFLSILSSHVGTPGTFRSS